MSLDKDLLQILRCPKCKGELQAQESPSGFVCDSCQLRYPIQDGIPNFLLSEAKPLGSSA